MRLLLLLLLPLLLIQGSGGVGLPGYGGVSGKQASKCPGVFGVVCDIYGSWLAPS